ncbi:cardiolipin synthase [Ferruginibacter sp.]
MTWASFGILLYVVILVAVCMVIIFETNSSNKSLAYLLFCLFIPVAGIVFYCTFGINYWRKRRYSKKLLTCSNMLHGVREELQQFMNTAGKKNVSFEQNEELANMLLNDLGSPLTGNNKVQLLINGERKFPEMHRAINEAKHHIHIEYYIYEYDTTGSELIELLIKKAREGVEVRFVYDDFGSPSIKKKLEKRMREAGIEIYPFYKVRFYILANRINYRNHRKIVVIDGHTAFVGGINVSDRYVNNNASKLYWRDTHVRIDGPAVFYLQYLFLEDWSFCCGKALPGGGQYFNNLKSGDGNSYVQVAAGGPDSVNPSVLYSILQTIYLAQEEILISTPYFIPGDSILDALSVAALSGLKVKLLVPGISDSRIVNAAARSYYAKLLETGVEIYLYKKGFIHAKTMVADGKLSVVGTANMDYRSFELNFEVNAVIYDTAFAAEMRNVFFEDIKHAEKIDKQQWLARPYYVQLPEKLARLFSPVL